MAKSNKDAERQFRLRLKLIDLLASTIHLLIPWGAAVLIFYFVSAAVRELAGKNTLADIGIRVLADVRISEAIAYLFGGGGIAYGLRQRRLRQTNIERLAARAQELERRIDAKRTSSGLTPRGTTRPEDKI